MAPLFFSDCSFDADARTLLRNGTLVALSNKTFDLLRILIEARPRAISQKELYDAMWPQTTVEIASLYNVIHALRTALGDSSKRIIRTVYGYGVAFAAEVTIAERNPNTAPDHFELEMGSKTIPLETGAYLIGRDHRSLIPTTSLSISRQHARIIVTDSSATLEDLGSTNGTVVSGQRIAAPIVLRNRDLIVFGDTLTAVFRAVPALPATARASAKTEVC